MKAYNISRSELPHIKSKQALSGARGKDAYKSEKLGTPVYNGLSLVSDDTYNFIEKSDYLGTNLSMLVKPSHINEVYNSAFQNSQKETLAKQLIDECLNAGNQFTEITINKYSDTYPFELEYFIDNNHLQKTAEGKYIVTNNFIKAFIEDGIYTLDKAKEKENQNKQNELKHMDEQKIYRDILDKVMYIYVYVNDLSIDEFKTYDPLKVLVENLTDNYLTLKKFDGEKRGTWDIYIGVKGVTFTSDPLRNNVMIGYLNGRSNFSLEHAFSNFIAWIQDTSKEDFKKQIKDTLHIFDEE